MKRWQFSVRGILVYTTLVAVAAWLWTLAGGSESVHLYPVAVMITGGAIGATLGWLIRGTASGFSAGFWTGAILVPVILMRGGH